MPALRLTAEDLVFQTALNNMPDLRKQRRTALRWVSEYLRV